MSVGAHERKRRGVIHPRPRAGVKPAPTSRTVISRNERDTERIAARFAKTLRGGETILLDGDLGAGKTVFARGLARGLGVRGRITSPTFVLMRVYQTDHRTIEQKNHRTKDQRNKMLRFYSSTVLQSIRHLVHVDAYRVRDARDLEAIGLFEWVGRPDTVIAIEWGERVASALRRFHPVRVVLRSTVGDGCRIVIRQV